MTTVPSPYRVQVKRWQAGTTDAYGNPTGTYASPRSWWVRSIAPGAMAESSTAVRDNMTVVEWTIHADNTTDVPGERDLVTIAGVDYAVNGTPADWTNGPWPNPVAGVVVELRRVDG